MASKEEEPQPNPDDCQSTQEVLVPYPDSDDSPEGFVFHSPVGTFQEPRNHQEKVEVNLNPFSLLNDEILQKFGYRISAHLDTLPFLLTRFIRTCKKFNDVLKACLTEWKVRALSRIIVENGNFLSYLLKNNLGAPIRIVSLGLMFFNRYERRFWGRASLSSWIELEENRKFFLFGPDKGMSLISIEGEF
jgi:hypothetical protein